MDGNGLRGLLKDGGILDLVGGEELLLEALRDMIKDEVKQRVRETLAEDPELHDQVKRAVGRYVEAKVLEGMAVLALTKASAKLSVASLPEDLRERVTKDVASSLERELHAALSHL